MSATKTPAESQDKAPSPPAVSKEPATPEKASGPQHAGLTTATSPAQPPNNATSVMRRADLVADREGAGAASRARTMMTLQRSVGNNRVSTLLGGAIQTKLTVGAVDDPHEREADSVAEAIPQQPGNKPASPPVLRQFVMKHSLTPPGSAQRQVRTEEKAKPETEEETETTEEKQTANPVQRKEDNEADQGHVSGNMERRIASPTGGRPLPEGLRGEMEAGLGADFSQVRVHDNAQDQADARSLNAKAFTHGEHVWLGAGESASDRKLMAHELAHVVQQGGGEVRRQPLDDGEAAEVPAPDETEVAVPEAEEAVAPETEEAATTTDTEISAPAEEPSAPTAETSPAPATETPNAEANVAPTQPQTELPGASLGPPDTAAAPNLPPEPPAGSGDLQAATPEDVAAPEPPATETPEETLLPTAAPSFAGGEEAFKPETQTPEPAASAGVIQRQESSDDDGILGGIRRRLRSVVDGLRSGWDSLTSMASSAFDTIRTQIGNLVDGLRNVINGALSAIQNAWTALVARVQQLADGVKRLVQAGVSAVAGAVQAIGAAIIRLDPLGLSSAWGRLTSIITGLNQRVQAALQVVFNFIAGLWEGLRARFNAILDRLTQGATALRERALAMVNGLRDRIASLWQGLRARSQQMSGVLGGVLERLRSLLSSLIEWGQQVWGRIQQGFNALTSRLAGFIQQIIQRVMSAWQVLRQRAMALWARLQPLWNRFKQSITQFLMRLANGVRTIWGRIVSLGIGAFINFIKGLRDIYRGMVQLYEDIQGFFEPIAAKVTDMIYSAMPQKALEFAREKIAEALGPAAAQAPEQSEESESEETEEDVGVETKVQRAPGTTATFSEIGTGFLAAINEIWRRISPSAVFHMVLDVLLEQLFPPLAIYRQLRDFIFQDLAAIGRGLYPPANIFSHPLEALHDIWTNLYHLIVDTFLSLLRRLVNILMAFQLWITIILTVIGFVGGATAGGILAGILGGLATVGIGAGPAAAGGATAGGAAGAGVGFGVALLVGEAVFFGFLIIHGATIISTIVDLKTTLQTRAEKQRDFAQLAESAIAVGVGLALLLLAWLAGTVAKGFAALIERLRIKPRLRLPSSVSRFLRGVSSTRKPPKSGLPTAEQAARLAAEQRLSRIIGGDLARLFVAELGPVLAEEVVSKLGPNLVRLLARDLTPEAIARIAANLSADAVERLIAGGMRPQRIHAAVLAGQAQRLAALSAEQVRVLSALSDSGFNRLIQLPENQFRRIMSLSEAQIGVFAAMDQAAFNRFAAMSDANFAKLSGLSPGQLSRWAAFDNATFAEVDLMLGNTKVNNAVQLDNLLTNAKVRDAAQLRGLVENPKVRDAAQLDGLLNNTKIADAAELENLLASAKVVDGSELDQVLGRYQSGRQVQQLLAEPTVASAGDLIRLADVMDQAGLPNATTGGLPDEALARYARPDALAELEATAQLQTAGRIRGLDQWITFHRNKNLVQLTEVLGELREAQRLTRENPGSVIDVAGEVNAPPRPGRPGEQTRSFDIEIRDSSGNVVRSVEVTTIANPVDDVAQITPGVRHATDKAAERIAEGLPIPGRLDATIQMRVNVGRHPVPRNPSVLIEVLPDGTVNQLRADTGAVIPGRTTNIFDDFTGNLGTIGNNQLLDRVTLVDPATGTVLGQWERVGGTWVRVR